MKREYWYWRLPPDGHGYLAYTLPNNKILILIGGISTIWDNHSIDHALEMKYLKCLTLARFHDIINNIKITDDSLRHLRYYLLSLVENGNS